MNRSGHAAAFLQYPSPGDADTHHFSAVPTSGMVFYRSFPFCLHSANLPRYFPAGTEFRMFCYLLFNYLKLLEKMSILIEDLFDNFNMLSNTNDTAQAGLLRLPCR